MIICASRRTDIPAFHSEWFLNRLHAGYAMVRNPIARNIVYRVDLSRNNVDCIVFITKDPRPMMDKLDDIERLGYRYVFQITITPYGKDIEPGVPSKADVADAFRTISDRIGKDRMTWRYDPIIINEKTDIGYHVRKFRTLCEELNGYTDTCIFSFVDVREKLMKYSGILNPVDEGTQMSLIGSLSDIAREYGMSLRSCCSDHDFSDYGVESGGCIDSGTLASLGIPSEATASPLRRNCRCVKNMDIGGYDTCGHDCIYCYANRNTSSERRRREYRPDSEMLSGRVLRDDTVVELSSRPVLRITDF